VSSPVRWPRTVLQTALYNQLHTAIPATPFYAVVPGQNVAFPYGFFGHFTANHDPEFKGGNCWEARFILNLWSRSQGTTELDTLLGEVLTAVTATDLTLTDSWVCYEVDVDDAETYELMIDEVGPLQHGAITLVFKLMDKA
jgi:hypothetical protein